MKKTLLVLFAFFSFAALAQNVNPWQKSSVAAVENKSKLNRTTTVSKFDVFSLDVTTFRNQLANAPKRGNSVNVSNQLVYFPDAEGNTKHYRIYEATVMHPELQAQFPEIRSYVGVCVDDKSSVVLFSMTIFGLHAMILSPKGTVLIDPFTSDLNQYMVYKKKDAVSTSSFECLTEGTDSSDKAPANFSPRNAYDIESNTGIFRTYRLGLACTVEYAQFHINAAGVAGGTVTQRENAVLSAMNVTMTRVNGVFERDMSLTMEIVPNNANVIFFLPEKPDALTNSSGGSLINEIQPIMNAGIGSANYDIGHVFSTGGGGIAQLFSPCSGNKARGVTGQGSPVGDPFDIDFVAHEIGHQFGANHTQNNSCQINLATAVEPGSASTIMGYAGICAPNVQNNSDDYFHTVSLAEMDAFVAGGGNCSNNISNNNSSPIIEPIPNYITPISTAFVLPGNATDADGDSLTYCWEQTNNEVSTQWPQPNNPNGPSFRSLTPSTSPDRFMPGMTTILTGNLLSTDANRWEIVPSVSRTMNFALTVRDNELINGSQTARRDITVTTTANAGPFLVNSPNTNVAWLAGSNQTVTWNVAGTTSNGIDCPFVDIFLSTDGGSTFPTLLASKVPNDGSELVSMPSTTGTQNRIMVKGNNHIFLDVSNTNFTITTTTPTFALTFDGQPDGQNKTVCQGLEATYAILYSTIGGFSGATTFSVTGNPAGTTATLSPTSLNTDGVLQLLLSNTALVPLGVYQMVVTGTSGGTTKSVNIYFEIFNSSFSPINLTSPEDLAFGQPYELTLTWDADANATNYDVEVATDLAFTNLVAATNVLTNSFLLSGLSSATNYFWRIKPKNLGCQGAWSAVNRFTTIQCDSFTSTNVPIVIPTTAAIVESTLTIPSGQNQVIQDITVNVNLTHSWINDLIVTLISPTGTQVRLVNRPCPSSSSFQNANVIFTTSGNALACAPLPETAISGTIIPNQSFAAFTGQNTEGIWILRVQDAVAQDGGSINSWSLNFCETGTNPLACGDIQSTWNGSSWSNGVPVNNVAAIINGDYTSSGDLECCSLTINNTAQVIVQSGHNLIVSDAVTVVTTANVTIESNANLIQLSTIQNSGEITVNRETSPLMRLDYAMWSTPVTGSETLTHFSPFTLTNRFYTYNMSTNVYNSISNPSTVLFEEGKGYLIRIPDNHPTTPTVWSGQFKGVPKNGAIDVPLTYISATQKFNAIGNPYPSTINAESFLTSNQTDLEGVIYFWRKTNNASGTAYATFTLGGATTTSPISSIPNGTIQVGQGFIVASQNVTNPTARFTNDLRVDNNSNQFFRSNFGLPYVTGSDMERHRIWLNLTNDANLFSQMMVGYMSNATNEVDALIDGKYIGDAATALSSWLAEEEYVIQGKILPFEVSDVVPLVFRTNAAGNFTISLGEVDGLFEQEQDIFIRDYLSGIVHDLRISSYAFTSEEGVFSNRFELVYEDTPLSLSDLEYANSVLVATGTNQLKIRSLVESFQKITVYDVLGRTLYESASLQEQEYVVPGIQPSQQTLLVRIVMNNGEVVVRKVHF